MEVQANVLAFVRKLIKEYDVSDIKDDRVSFYGVEMNCINHPEIVHRRYDDVTVIPLENGYTVLFTQTLGEMPIQIFFGE